MPKNSKPVGAIRFAEEWLSTTTCRRYGSVLWWSPDNRYVIMRHAAHKSYVDRVTGQVTCGAYSALYDTSLPVGRLGDGYLKKWEGRWTKACLKEAKQFLGRLTMEVSGDER